MGAGIAQLVACRGIPVVLNDISQTVLDRAMRKIKDGIARLVGKDQMSQEEADKTLSRVSTSTDLGGLGGADFVVEAVVEDEVLKNKLFAALDQQLSEEAILASNTSSISLTRLAAATNRPSKVKTRGSEKKTDTWIHPFTVALLFAPEYRSNLPRFSANDGQ